jgi:LytS/YehU family sensor histidine kinase
MIGSLVYKGDPDTVYDYFSRFARLIRSTLEDSEKIARPLKEELDFVKNYVEIQKARFKDKFDFVLNVDEKTNLSIEVPKMIIQTHAENAIKHGLMHKKEKGELRIDIKQSAGELRITINDNGIGRVKAATISKGSTGKGMQIIKQIFSLYNKLTENSIRQQITDLKDKTGNANGTEVILIVRFN